jgi:hypothetical protein
MKFLFLLIDIILAIVWGIMTVVVILDYQPSKIVIILSCYFATKYWVYEIIEDCMKF